VGGLRLGLFSLDSSLDADSFARGYCPPDMLLDLRKHISEHKDAGEWDYCIVMVHHHPQPIRLHEPSRAVSLTALANAGTLVEYLATSHVDLVLHGHEHCKHWGRYGSLEGEHDEITILGAASATGAQSTKPCDPRQASFNLLGLERDGSVNMTVHSWNGNAWEVGDGRMVVKSPTVRRHRILRRKSVPSTHAEAVKAVEITRRRDIWIRSIYPLAVKGPLKVGSDTGSMRDVEIVVRDQKGIGGPVATKVTPIGNGMYSIDWTMPEDFTPGVIEIRYRHLAGGVLWHHDLGDLPSSDQRRTTESEFVAFKVPDLADALQVSILLPEECDPTTLTVATRDEKGNVQAHAGLTRMLTKFGPGQFFLRVPYPDPQLRYMVQWCPPKLKLDSVFIDVANRIQSCNGLADELIAALTKVVGHGATAVVLSLDPVNLQRAVRSTSKGIDANVVVRAGEGLPGTAMCRAWWSEIVIDVPRDELVTPELRAIVLPIEVPLSVVKDPVAVVRVGVSDTSAAIIKHSPEQVLGTLSTVWGRIWDAISP
jgi:hypothetical protein